MNNRVFNYLDYPDFIKDTAKNLGISYKTLATSARIHTSYFSRVMQGRADFSKEQLFLISKDLKLGPEEIDYLLMLGELRSSSLEEHKKFVLKKIKVIQSEKGKLLKKLTKETSELSKEDIAIYYQESITAKVHILLTIPKYQTTPLLICKKLFISEVKLNQELQKLKNLKIINLSKSKISIIKNSVHLDESHMASQQNHINWRIETINHLIKRSGNPSDYHLSAMFSCDENGKSEIKDHFKKFIVEVQKIVQLSPDNDDAYFIGLDLY
jgi:transcriptional regulator with XRE-family HTH domain